MNVSDVIAILQKLPPDMLVVTFDNEWLEYDRVEGVVVRKSVELFSNPPTYFQTPKGHAITRADIITTDAVEIGRKE
ncbi:MAG: hypothetical protein KKH61_20595 [Gammaproteobacteria bacterium]|nr:hypothetical protein [Gammaproteobacteria bacterium]